ncbi:MAG: aminoacyl-tRNA hydrolase [Ruminococcaceae bacterium]|nr:aminoacyl-tRNA hydrolase [Oscillospiraceae bacterium]
MYVILGIGNPGKQYENTKHNIGFISLDYLAASCGIQINKIKHKALIGEGRLAGEKVILVKPQTYVNLSGESLRMIMDFYKLTPEELIVIYDDVSLEQGRVRIRAKGSDGGHNGIKSIIYHLQSDDFCRIKIGVGTPPPHYDLADWVLSKFSNEEIKVVSQVVDKVPDMVAEIMKNGPQSAMNRFNGMVSK